MRFSVGFLLAALTLSASATPVANAGKLNLPLVKRSGFVDKDGTVNPARLKSSILRTTEKMRIGLETYRANTRKRHSLDLNEFSKRAAASEPLVDEELAYGLWQGTISVGTPPKLYTVDFDTGSTDLFLPGPNCTTGCKGHAIYDPYLSTTAGIYGQNFTLKYADNSTTSGRTTTDVVTVAGMTARGQTLGVATQYSSGFNNTNYGPDGLLGLAWSKLSVYGDSGFFETLVAQGTTNNPVFGFKLAPNGSVLTLGYIDYTLFTGFVTYAPVVQEAYWQVTLDAISVNGAGVLGWSKAIIDTGTTLVLGPIWEVAELYKSIPGSAAAPADTFGPGVYTVPCDNLPSVSLTFGGRAFNISTASYNLGNAAANNTGNNCVGGIAGFPGVRFWIVGDVFLQNTYTVFDVGNSQVGFAELA